MQAEEDGVACVEHICGKGGHVDYNTVPGIVYTHPEVASVGKTEEQCKQEGIAVKVSKRTLLVCNLLTVGCARILDICSSLIEHLLNEQPQPMLRTLTPGFWDTYIPQVKASPPVLAQSRLQLFPFSPLEHPAACMQQAD